MICGSRDIGTMNLFLPRNISYRGSHIRKFKKFCCVCYGVNGFCYGVNGLCSDANGFCSDLYGLYGANGFCSDANGFCSDANGFCSDANGFCSDLNGFCSDLNGFCCANVGLLALDTNTLLDPPFQVPLQHFECHHEYTLSFFNLLI
jgi:hypothetical protein